MQETDVLKLKTIQPFDFISLNVLERWHCERRSDGMWGCWREGEESGTLWIDFSAIPLEKGTSRKKALTIAAMRTGNLELLAGHESGDDAHVWRYAEEAEENGEEITLYRWHLYMLYRQALVIVHYSLVFPTSMVGDKLIRMILGQMDEQISRTKVRLDIEAMQRHGHMHEDYTITGRMPRD